MTTLENNNDQAFFARCSTPQGKVTREQHDEAMRLMKLTSDQLVEASIIAGSTLELRALVNAEIAVFIHDIPNAINTIIQEGIHAINITDETTSTLSNLKVDAPLVNVKNHHTIERLEIGPTNQIFNTYGCPKLKQLSCTAKKTHGFEVSELPSLEFLQLAPELVAPQHKLQESHLLKTINGFDLETMQGVEQLPIVTRGVRSGYSLPHKMSEYLSPILLRVKDDPSYVLEAFTDEGNLKPVVLDYYDQKLADEYKSITKEQLIHALKVNYAFTTMATNGAKAKTK